MLFLNPKTFWVLIVFFVLLFLNLGVPTLNSYSLFIVFNIFYSSITYFSCLSDLISSFCLIWGSFNFLLFNAFKLIVILSLSVLLIMFILDKALSFLNSFLFTVILEIVFYGIYNYLTVSNTFIFYFYSSVVIFCLYNV